MSVRWEPIPVIRNMLTVLTWKEAILVPVMLATLEMENYAVCLLNKV